MEKYKIASIVDYDGIQRTGEKYDMRMSAIFDRPIFDFNCAIAYYLEPIDKVGWMMLTSKIINIDFESDNFIQFTTENSIYTFVKIE